MPLAAILTLCTLLIQAIAPSSSLEAEFEGGKKAIKGVYYENAALFNQVKGAQPCRIDSGAGLVISIAFDQVNPLFESKNKNKVHLLIWLKEMPEEEVEIHFPNSESLICYREEGDLLMFETFTATGWLKLKSGKNSRLAGSIEMNFVEPHQNFSNSDFQHLQGELKLLLEEL